MMSSYYDELHNPNAPLGYPNAPAPPSSTGNGGKVTTQPVGVSQLPGSGASSTSPLPSVSSLLDSTAKGGVSAGGGGASAGGDPGGIFSSLSSSMTNPAVPPNDMGMGALVGSTLKGDIKNGTTRFTPEVLAMLKGNLLASTTGRQAAMDQAAKDDAISRGAFRNGELGTTLAANARSAGADYTKGVTDVLLQKAQSDFTDKMATLDASEKWLNDTWDHALRQQLTDIQKEQLRANLALGYAQIQQQKDALNQNWQTTLLNRQPIQGRDFDYITGPDGQQHIVYYNTYDRAQAGLGA